jgi:hypothetical protein
MKRGLAVLAVALLAQAFVLYRAFHYGPMAGLIPWDDCLTLQRGLHNLRVVELSRTPWTMLLSLRDVVIHSPVSDLQALVGLMAGGGALWVPYALNVAVLVLVLYAVLFRPGRPGKSVFLALLLFVLVQPVTINALTFLKADWKSGLLIAAALFVLYEAAEQGRRGLKLFGAGLLGLGVAAKLTAFYMPVFALIALVAFEALALLARPPAEGLGAHLRKIRPAFSLSVALALGPFLAFFLLGALGHHKLLAYIAYAVGDTWSDGRTTLQRALYYSPFVQGGGAWGHLHWFVLAFGAGALAVSIRAKRRLYPAALAVMVGLGLVLLAPLVLAHTSNWEFGAGLLGVVMGAAMVSIRVFARDLHRIGGCVALAVVVCCAVTAPLNPPFVDPDVGAATPAELQALKTVYGDIAADIAARAPTPAPKVRLLYENSFAPFPDLSILYFQRTGQLIDIDRIDDVSHPEAITADLASTDFLLTSVPATGTGMRGLPRRFPTSADPASADRFVAAQTRFLVVRRYPLADGEIRLYQRQP